ncbi:hypothetical protein [Actinopolymorpha sp. B9G3]|uniref:hypothetical protein n=1 Tax=Actinopolymorpha sp. B9G3 TaxID=3158970 RepID=UPI0032D8BBE6
MSESAEVGRAIEELAARVDDCQGFAGEFSLEYTGGVAPPADAWLCSVEVEVPGGTFEVRGATAADTLREAIQRMNTLDPP